MAKGKKIDEIRKFKKGQRISWQSGKKGRAGKIFATIKAGRSVDESFKFPKKMEKENLKTGRSVVSGERYLVAVDKIKTAAKGARWKKTEDTIYYAPNAKTIDADAKLLDD